jgi:flagellar biosynthesis/type III secretory pathway protein FliH
MTYHMIITSDRAMMGSSTPLIKASERIAFCSAADMLVATQDLHSAAQAEIDAARAAAFDAGFAAGRAAALDHVAGLITQAAAQINTACTERREDIASAALAATRAIIGDIGDEQVARALVTRALSRIESHAPVTIDVAPAMYDRIAQTVAHLPHVSVAANAALGALDCTFLTENGRVIAGLDVQMTALAQRWGVASETEAHP